MTKNKKECGNIVMDKLSSVIMKIFNNVEKNLKSLAIFVFLGCIISAIVCLFMTITNEYLFTISMILFVSSVLSFPLYAFGEIITQLKQINEKIK